MSFAFFETHSQAMKRDEEVPSQAEIDREIAKLKEDSARDVQRQLEQQRSAAKKCEIEEDVKKVGREVEDELASVRKAAHQEIETIVNDAEVDMEEIRGSRERVESHGSRAGKSRGARV